MFRRFRRDRLREVVGNKNLRSAWRRLQEKKYGVDYEKICVDTQRRS